MEALHRVLDLCKWLVMLISSFMAWHSGYNQVFIADEDVPHMIFYCPGALGIYKWLVMLIGLKNVGATYQDDVVVRSTSIKGYDKLL